MRAGYPGVVMIMLTQPSPMLDDVDHRQYKTVSDLPSPVTWIVLESVIVCEGKCLKIFQSCLYITV